jgi:hypothetical protein
MLKMAPTPAAIDVAWMDALLRQQGIIADNRLTGLDFRKVGNGMSSDCFRFTLSYERPDPALPLSLMSKFAAADPASKAMQVMFGTYQKEVAFYRDLAPTLNANIPEALFADIDPETHDFTIIMRDLTKARALDDTKDCSIEDAEAAVREAARFHGARWNDPSLRQIPWLWEHRVATIAAIIDSMAQTTNAFLNMYADRLDAEDRRFVDLLARTYPKVLQDARAPWTIRHGDLRLDNLLFDIDGVAGKVSVLDWGTVSLANGLADISYLLGTALDADQRRAHERDLVRSYYDVLSRSDIGIYGWEDCWEDYRRFALLGLYNCVAAPSMVERSERVDRLFLKMFASFSRQSQALGSFEMWE